MRLILRHQIGGRSSPGLFLAERVAVVIPDDEASVKR
jgi:hypothetical protein